MRCDEVRYGLYTTSGFTSFRLSAQGVLPPVIVVPGSSLYLIPPHSSKYLFGYGLLSSYQPAAMAPRVTGKVAAWTTGAARDAARGGRGKPYFHHSAQSSVSDTRSKPASSSNSANLHMLRAATTVSSRE